MGRPACTLPMPCPMTTPVIFARQSSKYHGRAQPIQSCVTSSGLRLPDSDLSELESRSVGCSHFRTTHDTKDTKEQGAKGRVLIRVIRGPLRRLPRPSVACSGRKAIWRLCRMAARPLLMMVSDLNFWEVWRSRFRNSSCRAGQVLSIGDELCVVPRASRLFVDDYVI